MKRNLLSIVILVLLLVNTILTVVLMTSVVGTAKKTGALVDAITEALSLEMEAQAGPTGLANIPMTNIKVYTLPDSMTIPLKDDGDGKAHYCLLEASFSINTESPGYVTYTEDLSAYESLIRDKIFNIVSAYTMDEARTNQELIKQQILEAVQSMFDSDFIFNVSFGEYMFQ